MEAQTSSEDLPTCEDITIRTADGRVFRLGSPDSPLFRLRRRLYLWQRRHELREAGLNGNNT